MKVFAKKKIDEKSKLTNDEIVDIILENREIKNKKEFLNPKNPLEISLKNFGLPAREFKKVIEILKNVKKNNKTIVVYTDYDADGITGGAILWETLHLLGFNVMPYVPDRKTEGYGFSKKGIDNIKKQFDPALVISVDHGITKVKEIEYASSLGIQVIVTDHHIKQKEISKKAKAIFHIPALSGSGVSYFFSKEIFKYFVNAHSLGGTKPAGHNKGVLENNFKSDYLALASIGTIADMVPLVGPSRSLVKYGLKTFGKIKRLGIYHILKEAGIEGKEITPYEVGFIIAPRINAVGRLKSAIDALRLLCTTNDKRAQNLAQEIGQTNRQRQDLVEKAVNEAKKIVKNPQFELHNKKIIILVSDNWHEGIIGLIAAKIVEEFYRPTIILTKNDGSYKASARSIPGFHITDFLVGLKKYLVDVGGHKQAAGFNIEKEKLKDFMEVAQKKAEKLIAKKNLERKIEVDLDIPLSKINLTFAKKIELLAPFGIGNPKPTFVSSGKITGANLFGKNNDHLKFFVQDHSSIVNHQPLEFIAFFQAEKFKIFSRGQETHVVYTLDINRWNGRESLRGKLIDSINVDR